jgi:hypothetical protein
MLDGWLAVATVSSHCPGHAAGALPDTFHRWCQLRPVGGSAELDVVVQDDAIVVVGDLGLFCRAPCNAALGRWKSRTT